MSTVTLVLWCDNKSGKCHDMSKLDLLVSYIDLR